MRQFYYSFLVSFFICFQASTQEIRGNFQLDSTWRPMVYLSYIESLDDLTAMSTAMIVAETKIDDQGDFVLKTEFFSEEDRLYRIHIAKKSDPPTIIVFGEEDENHFFLITNRNETIHVRNESAETLFKNITFTGYSPNTSLLKVNVMNSYKDSTDYGGSIIKQQVIEDAIDEKLRYVADTAKNSLVSLYALHKTNFTSNYPVNRQFYSNYLDKWEDEESTYFSEFRIQLPIESEKSSDLFYVFICILCFVAGFGLHYVLKINNKKPEVNPLKSLSVQERKIFALLHEGKSNKEISAELSIGISTVKTHVSNIYAKLNIKSRKEAVAIQLH